jgi:hypothetical protein
MFNSRCTCVSDSICEPTFGSNVISIMLSTIILARLMSGSTYVSKVVINVRCAFGFGTMIRTNGILNY